MNLQIIQIGVSNNFLNHIKKQLNY